MRILVVEAARVIPASDSDSVLNSANTLAIPLTYFDLPWLIFHPVKRVFFYRHTESTREHFHSFLLPKLKLSLSLVLRHYLPLSGRITWDQHELKPSIVVSESDSVSVTIAETDADFSRLSGYGERPLSELHSLLPEFPVSDDSATAFALQITLFPDHGFCIGVAAHHAVLDGKTSSMFIKAWAYFCKQQHLENRISLPEILTPSLDRSLINDQTGLDEKMIEIVRSLKQDKTNSRNLSPFPAGEIGDDVFLVTLVLSRDDIEILRERVKSQSPNPDRRRHLSAFVIAYAYVWTCYVKARGGDGERTVGFCFVGDFRERLDPPLPATYFGNCMFPTGGYNHKAAEFLNEKGFVTAVEILSESVKGLSSRSIDTIAKAFADGYDSQGKSSEFGSVAGSNRLGVYESDFGWGRPVKVDVVSVVEGGGVSIAERRDESGGVEIGMCLKTEEMNLFLSVFNNGLKN